MKFALPRPACWLPLLASTCLPLSCSPEPVAPIEFEGTLDAQLVAAEQPSVYERLRPLAPEDAIRKSLGVSRQALVFSGRWRIAPLADQDVFLVVGSDSQFVATDADGDGALTAEERFNLEPLSGDDQFEAEATIQLKANHSRYQSYPLKVRTPRGAGMPGDGRLRFLWRSVMASLNGTVEIGGHFVQVRYDGFHPRSGQLDPTRNGLGVDSNGDGEIPADPRSPEWAYAQDETVVFRVGQHYVSTRVLDLDNGTFTMTAHDASEYQRIELTVGATIPDFDFVDFDGRQRSSSEFAGKPLLLDFWGAWCGPCIAEIPHLKEAYERFQSRGLAILGLDYDPSSRQPTPEQLAQGLDRAKQLIELHEISWPQARTDSILELIHGRFRISSYPTMVLLDAEGRIISAGARGHLPLRGPGLLKTLEKLFDE